METIARKPSPWVALLLSCLCPGLGQIYSHRWRRGLGWAVGSDLLVVVPYLSLDRISMIALWIALLVGLVMQGAQIVDAWRIAKSAPAHSWTRLRTLATCVAVFVVSASTDVLLDELKPDHRALRVPSGGMWPTLLIGDHFYTSTDSIRGPGPKRGDIVAFHLARDGNQLFPVDRRPDLGTEIFIKRIVGIPGDTIEIQSAVLKLNGIEMTGPVTGTDFTTPDGDAIPIRTERIGDRAHLVLDEPAPGPNDERVEYVVEPGRYFVLGDNRDNSRDSREWGSIRRDAIIGEVDELYWSWDFNGPTYSFLLPWHWHLFWDGAVRWDRIGMKP